MALFRVTSVIDSNTIKVDGWNWNNKEGNLVKIRGYKPPVGQGQYLKNRLSSLVLNNHVELVNARFVYDKDDIIICDVYLNGVNVAQYFPEYA